MPAGCLPQPDGVRQHEGNRGNSSARSTARVVGIGVDSRRRAAQPRRAVLGETENGNDGVSADQRAARTIASNSRGSIGGVASTAVELRASSTFGRRLHLQSTWSVSAPTAVGVSISTRCRRPARRHQTAEPSDERARFRDHRHHPFAGGTVVVIVSAPAASVSRGRPLARDESCCAKNQERRRIGAGRPSRWPRPSGSRHH